MEPVGKPVRRPRGRAATKSHHRRPSHDVAVRAFASAAGKGKTLLEYAAEMIKDGRVISQDDLQRLVDSGEFGRWLDAKYTDRKVVKTELVGELANPDWTPPRKSKPPAVAPGHEHKRAMAELAAIKEQFALTRDREEALKYCIENFCPQEFDARLAIITRDRHFAEGVAKAFNGKRK